VRHLLLAAAGLAAIAGNASAASLVTNGGFESTLLDQSAEFGDRYNVQQVTGWQTQGYNFVFKAGTADTTGANSEYGNVQLWGPNNGSANGFTGVSPVGGNYIAADGAYATDKIYQTINGLTVGKKYNVSFYWGGIQQYGYTGDTTEAWVVSLGNETHSTAIAPNVNHGFTGWFHENFQFTAQNSSDTLSFLAAGTPAGVPPFSVLDGVTMSVAGVPEPATWGLMFAGFGALGVASRRRRSRMTTVTA
jgi:hypothetical protein